MAIDDFDLGSMLTRPMSALDLSPRDASALLSFGLQAMQPVGIGQTPMGHLGQAVGAAGESVTRNEIMDQKEALAQNKLATAEQKLELARQAQATREAGLGIRERMADIAERRANSRKIGGLTDAFRARDRRAQENAWERSIQQDARAIMKSVENLSILPDPSSPFNKYKGMDLTQIQQALRNERPFNYRVPQGGSDDDEDVVADPDPVVSSNSPAPRTPTPTPTPPAPAASAPGATTPPVPNAKLAPDGHWYVQQNGKYFRVRQ